MKRKQLLFTLFLICCAVVQAKEYHVSVKGSDANEGTEKAPFRTIGKAAEYAFPGDIITVHAGTYREWINPPRGGESDEKRIVYRAAPGEKVEIKGSERISNWTKEKDGVWKVTIPNTFFGDYKRKYGLADYNKTVYPMMVVWGMHVETSPNRDLWNPSKTVRSE